MTQPSGDPPAKPASTSAAVAKLILSSLVGAALVAAILFLLAWQFFWQGWLSIAALFIPMTALNAYLLVTSPDLIERRKLKGRKLTGKQQIYMTWVYVAEIALFVVPALDHRFGWSTMPAWLSIVGAVFLVAANVVWLIAKHENPYAGSAVTLYEGHRLISTGPYALIRHPNYVGDLCMILGLALGLGSWWGLAIFALLIPAIVIMIVDEEQFLRQNLPGYAAYRQQTRYRLIPHVW